MFALWSNRQQSISKSDCAALESKISDLESRFSVEVKVVISEGGGSYPMGAVRGILALLFIFQAVAWFFWIHLPWWLFGVLPMVVAFLPSKILNLFRPSPLFSSKQEIVLELKRRAQAAFENNKIGETETKNGLLVYFSMPEHRFYLLPDTNLHQKLGAAAIDHIVNVMRDALQKKSTSGVLFGTLNSMLAELDQVFTSKLPKKSEDRGNEMPNTIMFD